MGRPAPLPLPLLSRYWKCTKFYYTSFISFLLSYSFPYCLRARKNASPRPQHITFWGIVRPWAFLKNIAGDSAISSIVLTGKLTNLFARGSIENIINQLLSNNKWKFCKGLRKLLLKQIFFVVNKRFTLFFFNNSWCLYFVNQKEKNSNTIWKILYFCKSCKKNAFLIEWSFSVCFNELF